MVLQNISSWGTTYVCLSRDEEHARGVVEFVKFMTQKDTLIGWSKAFGSLPARIEAIEDPDYKEYVKTNMALNALSESYECINYLPSILGSAVVRTEIDKMVQNVVLGLSDAETAFDAFVVAANAALND